MQQTAVELESKLRKPCVRGVARAKGRGCWWIPKHMTHTRARTCVEGCVKAHASSGSKHREQDRERNLAPQLTCGVESLKRLETNQPCACIAADG